MTKKNEVKHDVPFNFGESPLIKGTEEKLVNGYQRIESEEKSGVVADGGTGQPAAALMEQSAPAVQPVRDITAPAVQQQPLANQEPTQYINIPIPMSQHTRMAVIKAHTRQNIKDLVVQAIDLWLDVQEGKKAVKTAP